MQTKRMEKNVCVRLKEECSHGETRVETKFHRTTNIVRWCIRNGFLIFITEGLTARLLKCKKHQI